MTEEADPSVRPLSSSTYDDHSPPSFPLYRPAPDSQPAYESQSPYRAEIDPRSLPTDRKIRKATKIQLTEKAIQDLPELEEDDLRSFYAAVMESGRPLDEEIPQIEDGRRMSMEERHKMIEGLAGRFIGSEAGPSRLPTLTTAHGQRDVSAIVERLRSIRAPDLEEGGTRVPLGMVGKTEWSVLLDELANRDGEQAESLMDLMSVSRLVEQESRAYVHVSFMVPFQTERRSLKSWRHTLEMGGWRMLFGSIPSSSNVGHFGLNESPADDIAGVQLSDTQSDLLVESHLNHSPALVYPAINLVQSLATTGKPLPQSSYAILLTHLTSSSSTSQNRSLAWDLFANMRLTAHASPTPAIYSTMISACSSPKDPQPERARDLWIELNESVSPERREYDAIIKALSSTKSTYLEAFDLFRQMLAKHTEATFVPFTNSPESDMAAWSRFIPTAETFNALLEGTKRAGDLNRARWVLNEVVKLQGGGRGWRGVNEELMSGVFMTYASWKPVVRRQLVKQGSTPAMARESRAESPTIESDESSDLQDTTPPSPQLDGDTDLDAVRDHPDSVMEPSSPAHTAPQTSADAIREAKVLFDQIIRDTQQEASGPFTDVRLTTRLINSYLSVHLAHASSIAAAREAWEETWALVPQVKKNGWSMMQVLERCAAGEQGKDRDEATRWARAVWEDYLVFAKESAQSAESRQRAYTIGLGPRQIEKTYKSIIRALSLSPSTPIEEPISVLSDFHSLYPPSTILDGYSATPATPFQIRMTDRTRIAESDIPPTILFGDVDVLHQRLVREGRKELGWLKWVCKSYEVALRKRRKWRLKGRGEEGRRRRRQERVDGNIGEEDIESEDVMEAEDWDIESQAER